MRKLRDVLRNEYIGAIAIGFLLAQSVIHFIGAIIQPLTFALSPRTTMFGRERVFSWELMILPSVVSAFLDLLAGYLLFRWLYGDSPTEPSAKEQATDPGVSG